ncbi:hypothetical protein HPP92_027263 [Vanilla planifolia]|uniref:Uncharacterized protein n=1 Tax=Vanilla planifolia TaxID=51239 RepID=A0A835PCF9_VANPL|nr:hypothetical protein HPP92_027263 [Vanilla planifolia]
MPPPSPPPPTSPSGSFKLEGLMSSWKPRPSPKADPCPGIGICIGIAIGEIEPSPLADMPLLSNCKAEVRDEVEGEKEEEEEEEEDLLFFLEPPPTGTFLRDPPSVQYLLHVLQKYLGWLRL